MSNSTCGYFTCVGLLPYFSLSGLDIFLSFIIDSWIVVEVSDFLYSIIVARRIHINNIITISIENLKE